MRAERRTRNQHRPIAVIRTAIDQRVTDVDGALEQKLELLFVKEGTVEQLAPIAIAIGKFKRRVRIELDRNVALRQRLAQQIRTVVIATMRKVRRYLRAGRQRHRSRSLPQVSPFKGSRGAIKLDRRLRHHRSTSPNTMSSEPRMAETSASRWPLQMKSIACRCAKPGARILHLYGLLLPSATR